MRTFTFNTDKTSPKSSLVNSLANPTPAVQPEFTLGESFTANIYLISPSAPVNGGYDANSGNASLSVKVGLGTPGGVPSQGTFTLTFGGQTTSALAFNSTAAQIQTALQALSSIGSGNCLVTGIFPSWDVQFIGALGHAAQALMTADASLLWPRSSIDIGNEQVGSGTANAIQSIDLALQPCVLQTSWTPITQSVPSGQPTGGTFTLSFAGQTTGAIAYNALASTIQTALQGLSTIGSGNCTVTGLFPNYSITFTGALANSPEPLITASSSLTPTSTITIATTQVGGGTNNSVQSMTLAAVTTSNIGWTGVISLNTAQLVELFDSGNGTVQSSISTTMEFQYVDGSGNITIFGSPTVRIYHRVIDEASIGAGPFSNAASGSFNIANGADNGTVTGLGLSVAPRMVLCTVRKAAGGLNLFATIVSGTIGTSGFQFNLNGVTDSSNYWLDYTLIF